MTKSHLRTKFTEVETFIDKETGEVVDQNVKKHKYLTKDKEEFMLLYVSVLPIFINLSHGAKSVYAFLLANYDSTTVFEIGGGLRGYMAQKIGISSSNVANSLTELKAHKLIYLHSKAMYQINPRYAFKGSTSDRQRHLKVIMELGCKDC